MAASEWYRYHRFKLDLGKALIDLSDATADTFKVSLHSSSYTPSLSANAVWGDISASEIAGGTGYTAGGQALTSVTWTNNAGTVTWDAADVQWTASGGPITARYAVVRHVSTGVLIAYTLLDTTPADKTASDGNPFLIQIPSGLITLA